MFDRNVTDSTEIDFDFFCIEKGKFLFFALTYYVDENALLFD